MKHPLSVDLSVNHEDGEMFGSPIPEEKKIPSELIMPYLERYFMVILEELAYCNVDPAKSKERFEAIARFVRFTCGVHARLAISNEADRLSKIPDDELKAMAEKIFKEK